MRILVPVLTALALAAALWAGLRIATCERGDRLACLFSLPPQPVPPGAWAPTPPMPDPAAPPPDDPPMAPPPDDPQPVTIRSHAWPAALQYPLAGWNAIEYRVGHVDTAVIEPGGLNIAQAPEAPVPPESELVLSGWAGHPLYGVRMSHVLFAMCGSVVGAAPIGLERPDVAAAVHPNLGHSGWRARLATGALPRCGDGTLRVLALAPSGFNVFPLFETLSLTLAPPAARPDGRPVDYEPLEPPVSPEIRDAPQPVEIIVTAETLRMRRCGSTDCDVVGRLDGGRLDAFVIDGTEDWLLVQAGPQVGWIARAFIQAVERD